MKMERSCGSSQKTSFKKCCQTYFVLYHYLAPASWNVAAVILEYKGGDNMLELVEQWAEKHLFSKSFVVQNSFLKSKSLTALLN